MLHKMLGKEIPFVFGHKQTYRKENNSNTLSLKFDHFPISLYRALLHEEVNKCIA